MGQRISEEEVEENSNNVFDCFDLEILIKNFIYNIPYLGTAQEIDNAKSDLKELNRIARRLHKCSSENIQLSSIHNRTEVKTINSLLVEAFYLLHSQDILITPLMRQNYYPYQFVQRKKF